MGHAVLVVANAENEFVADLKHLECWQSCPSNGDAVGRPDAPVSDGVRWNGSLVDPEVVIGTNQYGAKQGHRIGTLNRGGNGCKELFGKIRVQLPHALVEFHLDRLRDRHTAARPPGDGVGAARSEVVHLDQATAPLTRAAARRERLKTVRSTGKPAERIDVVVATDDERELPRLSTGRGR